MKLSSRIKFCVYMQRERARKNECVCISVSVCVCVCVKKNTLVRSCCNQMTSHSSLGQWSEGFKLNSVCKPSTLDRPVFTKWSNLLTTLLARCFLKISISL